MTSKEEKKMSKEVDKFLRVAERSVKKENFEYAAHMYKKASVLAHKIGDKKSVDYALEAVKYNLKIRKYFNVGWSYRNAAMFSKDFKDFNNTISFSLKAIPYFSKTNSLYAIQWCYNLAGGSCEEMGDYLTAAKYYRKSLDIEKKDQIEKKLDYILKKIPHPTIEQFPDRSKIKEGEDVILEIRINNESKEILTDINFFNIKSEKILSLERIEPGKEKIVSLKINADKVGMLTSPLKRIEWKTKGGEFKDDVDPFEMPLKPNIELKPYLKNRLRVGNYSYFVISVRNNSPNTITEVDLNINFPRELNIKPVTGYYFNEIGTKEEKGFVFQILPTIVGKTRIEPQVVFKDSNQNKHEIKASLVLEETLEPPKDMDVGKTPPKPGSMESIDRLEKLQDLKRYVGSMLIPLEISEPEYISLTKRLHHVSKGYTLKDIDLETAIQHILEECKSIRMVSEHKLKDEALFMFSGESTKENRIYLITIVVKKEDQMLHLAFRAYSDKDEKLEKFLSDVAEIIKHTIVVMSMATEVEKIEIKKTINIIDSIVQRSDIGTSEGKEDKEINVKDSIVQRTEL